ncbi:hypothetical protein V8E53_002163 [Lactarius tabidus]
MSSDMAMASFESALMMSVSASTSTPRPPRPHAPRRISSSASTPTCQSRPIPHDLTTPRAQARAARLRAIEAEECREDQAALVTTPAQWALLRRSFVGVKTEFTDLDGLSWDAARTGTYQPVCASSSAPALALDDSTVRPYERKKQRLSVAVHGWEQAMAVRS